MSDETCRLCFEERARLIGIFGAEGLELNIAETIRVHFVDEANENDQLPKSICRDCWTQLESFHQFYNSVNEARVTFMLNFVKHEDLDFVEIKCNDDIFTIKIEPDELGTEPQMSSLIDNEISVSEVESSRLQDNVAAENETSSDAISHFNDGHYPNDSNDADENDASQSSSKAMKLNDKTSQKRVRKITTSRGIRIQSNRQYDHLIPNYMDMFCENCKHPFDTFKEACKHYTWKHKQKNVFVRCCQRRLSIPGQIRDHVQYHLNEEIFKCDECGKNCRWRDELTLHKLTHSGLECNICPKKFRTKYGLKEHKRTKHTPNSDHECRICNARFNSNHRLTIHVRDVHEQQDDSRFKCEYCGKAFKKRKLMRYHVQRVHEQDEEVYKCPHCQKQFGKKCKLIDHTRYHHSFKIYKCDICGKESKDNYSMKKHMIVHSEANSYKCNSCGEMFRLRSSLDKHNRRMHWDDLSANQDCDDRPD